MNKEQIKEALLGEPHCKMEKTPLCHFATFEPDMEIVELLLKGTDIDKAFNNRPIEWVHQFCEPNWDKMLCLLFKYKYYALKLDKGNTFKSLITLLNKVEVDTVLYVLKSLKKHHFELLHSQYLYIRQFPKVMDLWKVVFNGE